MDIRRSAALDQLYDETCSQATETKSAPSAWPPTDPIFTIDEAAADLSVSRRTIYDWVHKGIIEPPQKLGLRRVGYRRSTIDRFKASRPAAFQPRR